MYCTIDKMKKILSLLLIFAVLIQLPSLFVGAAETAAVGKTEAEFIHMLGITGNWSHDEAITRAEFINAAIRCFIKDSGAKDSGTISTAPFAVFNDVAENYWAACNIDIAKKTGIISGTQNGNFEPEGYLSYSSAIKIALNILGYTPVAEQKGGFPEGYIITAEKTGVGLPFVSNKDILTKGEAAIILKNMLETAPMKEIYVNGEVDYAMPGKDDDTLLNKTFSIRSFYGVVVSNQFSSVDSTETMQEGKVKIKSLSNGNSGVFDVGDTKAADMLGVSSTVYYHDDMPSYKLFYITADESAQLVIDGLSIINSSYQDRKIEYEIHTTDGWETKTSKSSVKIPRDANIIHNGIFSGDVKGIFDILGGKTEYNTDSIILCDSDNDGRYDTAKINTYYTLHTDYIYDDENRLVITDNTISKSVIIDKNNDKISVKRYTADGYNIDGYGIIEGNTVSVFYGSGDIELYSLYISKNTTSDIITATDEDKLFSEEYTYHLSNTLLRHYEPSGPGKTVNLGGEYSLFTDHKGLISGFYAAETGYDTYYGIVKNKDEFIYIMDTNIDDSGLNDNVIQFRTVNLEAEVNIITSAEKLTIDGVPVKNGTGGISCADACEMVKGKLVKYTTDAKGFINTITLPLAKTEDNLFSYTVGFDQENGPVELRYRAGPRTFYRDGVGATSVSSKTTILWVPHNDLIEKGIDVNLYCKRGVLGNFTSDQYYYVNAYKVNNSSVTADILIAYDNGEYRVDSFAKPVIVRDVRKSFNKYGNPAMKVYGVQDNKEVEIASEDTSFKNRYGTDVVVSPGDIIRCDLNARGDCDAVNILFDYSDYEEVTTSYSSGYRAIKASVYHHDSNAMFIIKNKWDITDEDIIPANMESQVCTSSAKIYLYKTKEKTLTKVNSGYLVDYKFDNVNYSRVVVANSFATPDLIVIFE